MYKRPLALLIMALLLLGGSGPLHAPASAQGDRRLFPQTSHSIGGRFLDYWDSHGGLAQQGYPLTDEVLDVSQTDGQTYTVQYFERAVFESHPGNAQPFDVLLSLLGTFEYSRRYGPAGAPDQHASSDNPIVFTETQHTLGGVFRTYWEGHGGLPQQGYPISDEFSEVNALDGKPYTVQYFQRAVFERHPENVGTPYEVLLSQLGTYRLADRRNPQPAPLTTPTPLIGPVSNLDNLGIALRARDVVGDPVITGDYLYYATHTPSGSVALYRVDLIHSGPTVTLTEQLGQRTDIAASYGAAVWLEAAPGGRWRFRSANSDNPPTTGVTTLCPSLPARAVGRFSYRGAQLYYEDTSEDHVGLWALQLLNCPETLIAAHGHAPVGGVLWTSAGQAGTELHVGGSGRDPDTLLATAPNGFSGYDIQSSVVWAAQAPAADERVYLYDPFDHSSRPLSSGPGLHPLIKGAAVMWAENRGPAGWSLSVYNQRTGTTLPLLPVNTVGRLQPCGILEGTAAAFTLEHDGQRDLYLRSLPVGFPQP